MVKKRICSYLKTVLVLLAIIILSPKVLAADPGHVAGSISAGVFESGNFRFSGKRGVAC